MRTIKVAFYGRISDASGYGTSARSYVHALHRAGLELSVINLNMDQTSQDPLIASLMNRKMDPDFHLINFLPIAAVPLAHYLDKVILATSWETDLLPTSWVNMLNRVLEVWAPCDHNVSVYRKQLSVPVFRWPKALHPQFGNGSPTDPSKLPPLRETDFVFYSIFEWQGRKCPEGMIEAFLRAFPQERDVVLILKFQYGPRAPEDILRNLREKVKSNARVEIINGLWSAEQIQALTERGDSYVSLHRGEGWCNPLFDAACRGKPVVATGYSGPLDYLSPEDHCLVGYKLVPVEQEYFYFSRQMHWAEPNLDHAAELMREVYEHYTDKLERARNAAEKLKARYSSEVVGELARNRLAQLI